METTDTATLKPKHVVPVEIYDGKTALPHVTTKLASFYPEQSPYLPKSEVEEINLQEAIVSDSERVSDKMDLARGSTTMKFKYPNTKTAANNETNTAITTTQISSIIGVFAGEAGWVPR